MNQTGVVLLLLLIIVSLLAPWIAPHDPLQVNMQNRLSPSTTEHWLGTDTLGRDVFSRLLYGGRTSMSLALMATAGTMTIGLLVGSLAGYFGGWFDEVTQIFVKIFQSLPTLSFMLAIAGILGPGFTSILIATLLVSWADFSRVVRGEVLKVREENYVAGIRALGGTHFYILWKHIIPNIIGPFMVLFTAQIGRMVIAIASLSYLGLGLQPPNPDWGVMICDAKIHFRTAPHLMFYPAICIMLFCFSVNLLGDAIRDRLDTSDRNYEQFL